MDAVKLEKPEREEAIRRLRSYVNRDRDEPAGDLYLALLYDFIAQELAPFFYNAGLTDAQAYVARFADSLDADLDAAKRHPPRTPARTT